MLNSIVHISSLDKENKSFGTGFIIENNTLGTYILTCEHVLTSVQHATVDSHAVEIVAQSNFLDMAIIFIPSFNRHDKVTLQLNSCSSLQIKTIAFSSFKKNLVQKSTIHATLFKDFIELHSTKDDSFYLIKKIKADKDYVFSRGNSGAPIICTHTGNVIAMLSNKKDNDIAYAIGVSSLKKLLEQLREEPILMKKHKDFYNTMFSFKEEVGSFIQAKKNPKNRAIHSINELRKEKRNVVKLLKKKFYKIKYFLLGIFSIFALYGAYSFFTMEKVDNTQYYKTTNLPLDETLNVREGAGRAYKVIDELLPNTNHIVLLKCKHNDEGTKWCQIKYQNIKGWVHSYYILKDNNIYTH